jgi:hypothetical protein
VDRTPIAIKSTDQITAKTQSLAYQLLNKPQIPELTAAILRRREEQVATQWKRTWRPPKNEGLGDRIDNSARDLGSLVRRKPIETEPVALPSLATNELASRPSATNAVGEAGHLNPEMDQDQDAYFHMLKRKASLKRHAALLTGNFGGQKPAKPTETLVTRALFSKWKKPKKKQKQKQTLAHKTAKTPETNSRPHGEGKAAPKPEESDEPSQQLTKQKVFANYGGSQYLQKLYVVRADCQKTADVKISDMRELVSSVHSFSTPIVALLEKEALDEVEEELDNEIAKIQGLVNQSENRYKKELTRLRKNAARQERQERLKQIRERTTQKFGDWRKIEFKMRAKKTNETIAILEVRKLELLKEASENISASGASENEAVQAYFEEVLEQVNAIETAIFEANIPGQSASADELMHMIALSEMENPAWPSEVPLERTPEAGIDKMPAISPTDSLTLPPKDNKLPLRKVSQPNLILREGTKVQCHYAGQQKTYPGTIKSIDSDGKYIIVYEDGDFETNVDRSLILVNDKRTPLHVDVRACKTGKIHSPKKNDRIPLSAVASGSGAKTAELMSKVLASLSARSASPTSRLLPVAPIAASPAREQRHTVASVISKWTKQVKHNA